MSRKNEFIANYKNEILAQAYVSNNSLFVSYFSTDLSGKENEVMAKLRSLNSFFDTLPKTKNNKNNEIIDNLKLIKKGRTIQIKSGNDSYCNIFITSTLIIIHLNLFIEFDVYVSCLKLLFSKLKKDENLFKNKESLFSFFRLI